MQTMVWKGCVILLAFVIIFSFGLVQGFSSYNKPFIRVTSTHGNGTVIVIAALDGWNVNGKIILTPESSIESQQIIYSNGTIVKFTSQKTINFHFNGKLFSGGSANGGPGNISINGKHPLDSGIIYNVSSTYYLFELIANLAAFENPGVNYFTIYVNAYAAASITMVGRTI